MKDRPSPASLPGTRLLAFASRWFEPVVVTSVFEPLVADWQREWHNAPRASRLFVRTRGAAAFVVTSLSLVPPLVLAPLPSALTRRLTRQVAFYCALTVLIQVAVIYMTWRSAAPPPSAWLFLVPALFTTLLPFAMVAGVDAIRCHEAWPEHVQRRAAFKLAALVTAWVAAGGGWIVPDMNQRWQVAVDSANAGQAVAPLTRVTGLSTSELLTVGDHDSRSTTLLFPGERRREFERRVSFALLPILLLWIRWRLLDQGPTDWFVPMPLSVIGAMGVCAIGLGRALDDPLSSVAPPWQYTIPMVISMFFAHAVRAGQLRRRQRGAL